MIINTRTRKTLLARTRVCAGFLSRLIGLQFRRHAALSDGALLVCFRQHRVFATVHTLGMASDIGLVWLDTRLTVVDMKLAKPWRLAHVPNRPAKYCLEADESILSRVQVGDKLTIHGVNM